MPATQTAIIVPVPEVDRLVRGVRASLDRSAGWGVPAHVTVLYPFLPPDRVNQPVLDALADAMRSVTAFDAAFSRVEWFGDHAVWLAPEPDEPFRALTEAVQARFPECPPYEGAHADIVPHLTIGHDAPRHVLAAAADSVRPGLPVQARVAAAHLLRGAAEPGSWHTIAEFPLCGATLMGTVPRRPAG